MGASIRYSSEKWLLVLLAAWVALGLFGHDPWKPDEAYTFGLVYHILQTGDWLVPTLAGEPFVEKPPLFFWTAALFAKAFGWLLPPHDGARLASAFYVGLALFFTYHTAQALYGRGLVAALLLAASLGYLQHAHQLITDNALLAGVAMGLYGIATSRGLFLGTGAGIAFLSKGLLGPGVLAITAFALLAFPRWRRSWRAWPSAVAAFLPWALIWPWLLYRHSPQLFDEWFWVNNFGRFSGSAGLGGVLDHWHYAKALPWFALPAWPLAAWALWKERHSRFELVALPLTAFVVMLVVLSAASSARTLYGLPMLLPLSLLAAAGFDSAPPWLSRVLDHLAVWLSGILAIALWAAWVAFVAGWRPAFLEAASPGFIPRWEPVALLAALGVTVLWVLSLKMQPRLPVRWLAGVTLVWGLCMTLWLPWIDHAKTYRGMIADMQRSRPQVPGCVASRNLTEPQRALFHYFAGMLTLREDSAPARDCALLLVHSSEKTQPLADGWKLAWRGTRPGDDKEWFWLFSR